VRPAKLDSHGYVVQYTGEAQECPVRSTVSDGAVKAVAIIVLAPTSDMRIFPS
jgi:hypothetical protein